MKQKDYDEAMSLLNRTATEEKRMHFARLSKLENETADIRRRMRELHEELETAKEKRRRIEMEWHEKVCRIEEQKHAIWLQMKEEGIEDSRD